MLINGVTFYYLTGYRKLLTTATLLVMVAQFVLHDARRVVPLPPWWVAFPYSTCLIVLTALWCLLAFVQTRYGAKAESREWFQILFAKNRDNGFFLNPDVPYDEKSKYLISGVPPSVADAFASRALARLPRTPTDRRFGRTHWGDLVGVVSCLAFFTLSMFLWA
jgi:hypothetical protein